LKLASITLPFAGDFKTVPQSTGMSIPTCSLPFGLGSPHPEEIVVEWIKAEVVGDYEQHVNSQIAKKLNESAITEQPLPWDPTKGVVGTPVPASDNAENGNNPP
jgi:hypothetical protein